MGSREAHNRWKAKNPDYWRVRYRSTHPIKPPKKMAFCKHGHEMTEANTYRQPNTNRGACRECTSIRSKAWAYLNKYGLTSETFDQMVIRQNNVCVICNQKEKRRRLSVDHDHDTGKIRDLLCGRCNKSIGLFEEDPELLRKAAEYLEKHKEPKSLCEVSA